MELENKVKVIDEESFWHGLTGKIVVKYAFNNFLVSFVYRSDDPLSSVELVMMKDSQLKVIE
jgi:hypothetical protein